MAILVYEGVTVQGNVRQQKDEGLRLQPDFLSRSYTAPQIARPEW